MRDSCGICAGLYTAEEEEMDTRLILKNPHQASTSPKGRSMSPTTSNSTTTSSTSSPTASPKAAAKVKLAAIVESKETAEEAEPVAHIGSVEEEEEEEEEEKDVQEEKKDDDEEGAVFDSKAVPAEEELRTPLSSDFTAVPPDGADAEEEEDVALTSRPQRNFDDNPTQLYLTLMRKDWDATIVRSGKHPDEVGTWIYRKENDGSSKLRWKLLPIHASIIFGAPVSVLKTFLTLDPSTAMAPDDQGMIPLHLAVRMGCPAPIIRALVNAAPKSKQSRDRKGRTPRDLALRQTGTVRELMLAALDAPTDSEKAKNKPNAVEIPPPSPAAVVVTEEPPATPSPPKDEAAAAATPVVQERAVMSTPVAAVPEPPKSFISSMLPSPIFQFKPDPAMAARVHLLELQLERSEKNHADVTARLENMIASEMRLRTEHATLQETAAQATTTYVEAEMANKAVITNLVNQVGDLQSKVTTLTCQKAEVEASMVQYTQQVEVERGEHKALVQQLEHDLNTTTSLQHEAEARVAQLTDEKEQLERTLEHKTTEMVALHETIAAQEIKLEEVTLSEQELAWKVNSLQETIKNMPDPVAHDREIERLENDKKELKGTVHKLSVKLYKVVGFLDEMVQEQDAIIAESLTNTTGATPPIVDGDGSSKSAAGSAASSTANNSADDRQKMLTSVTGMKEQIGAIIESVLGNMPDYRVTDEVDDDEEEEVTAA